MYCLYFLGFDDKELYLYNIIYVHVHIVYITIIGMIFNIILFERYHIIYNRFQVKKKVPLRLKIFTALLTRTLNRLKLKLILDVLCY